MKVYPVTESELNLLRTSAFMSLLIVGIPFLIVDVFRFVARMKRETQFAPPIQAPTPAAHGNHGEQVSEPKPPRS